MTSDEGGDGDPVSDRLTEALTLTSGLLEVSDEARRQWVRDASELAAVFRHRADRSSPLAGAQLTLALSGGGFRATAYGLGAMIYLVHSGLIERTSAIVSVSGGSVTNGFVAARADAETLTDLDRFADLASSLATGVAHAGFPLRGDRSPVREPWLAGPVLIAVLLVIGAGVLTSWWPGVLIGFAMVVAMTAAVLLLRGRLARAWLRRLLAPNGATSKTTIGDLVGDGLDHILCATELITGRPLYVSTYGGGRLLHETYGYSEANDLALVDGVYASAAFPTLLPPLRMGSRAWTFHGSTQSVGGLLSDGGVWNNFGTDWLEARQSHVVEGEQERSRGRGRTESESLIDALESLPPGGGDVVVVVDAGETPVARRTGRTAPAVIARVMQVLYQSSLDSRIGRIEHAARSLMVSQAGRWGGPGDPVPPTASLDGGTPLQVRVSLSRDVGESAKAWQMWGGLRHWTPDDSRNHAYEAAVRRTYGHLLSGARKPVKTTFNGLGRDVTLELIVRGYLATGETLSSAFSGHETPEPLAAKWFEALV